MYILTHGKSLFLLVVTSPRYHFSRSDRLYLHLAEISHEASQADDKSHLRWLGGYLNGVALDAIYREQLNRVAQQKKSEGVWKATMNRMLEVIQAIFLKTDEVWPEELLARKPEQRGKTLYEVLFANGAVNKYPITGLDPHYDNDEAYRFGHYIQKGLFEEYAQFGCGYAHDLAPFDDHHEARGLRWPVVDGKETRWRCREAYDPLRGAGLRGAVLREERQEGRHLRASLRTGGGITG